jgi:hypothetical protein
VFELEINQTSKQKSLYNSLHISNYQIIKFTSEYDNSKKYYEYYTVDFEKQIVEKKLNADLINHCSIL